MRCLQLGKHVRLLDLQNGCASTTLPWLGGRAVAVGREHLILHCLQPPPRTQTKCPIGIRVSCHPPRLRSRNRPTPHTRTRSRKIFTVVVVAVVAVVVAAVAIMCRSRSRFVVIISRFGFESSFVGGFQQCRSHQAVSPR